MKTLEQCYKICEKSNKFKFVKNGGFVTFSYTKGGVTLSDFESLDAKELRGLTFCDGKAYPMIHKFFNYGETEESLDYNDNDVESIQIKDDGSTISFVKDAYGKIFPKTKSGFSNEIVDMANKWLNIGNNRYSINDLLNDGYHPIFEAVSPSFKMVLDYDIEELILIQIRRDDDWTYLNEKELIHFANKYNLVYKEFVNKTLTEILKEKSTTEGIEGYIVRLKNGEFMKVKMDWYFKRHGDSEGLRVLNELILNINCGEDSISREGEELPSVTKFFKSIEELMALKEYEEVFNFGKLRFENPFQFRKIIKELDENFQIKYTQIYRTFLSEYSTETNIFSSNGLLRIILDNRLDDYIPKLTKDKVLKFKTIESSLYKFISKEEKNIIDIINNDAHPSSIKSGDFQGLTKMILGRRIKCHQVRGLLKETLRKNLSKEMAAKKFINNLKERYEKVSCMLLTR